MNKTEQKIMRRIDDAKKIGMTSIRVNGIRECNVARLICSRDSLTYVNQNEYIGGEYYYNHFKKQHTTTNRKLIVTGILKLT
jgi:hypothetical protein